MTEEPISAHEENPLSSAHIRYHIRIPVVSAAPGPTETRPFGLRHARIVPTPVTRSYIYCPAQQVVIGGDGRPLIETMAKEWESKSSTDGDEGPEEN
jgi:putative ATP-grasp target RiPP